MRVFVLVFAVILAVTASPVKEERNGLPVVYDWKQGEKCPAPAFYDNCNYCFCGNDGYSAGCTYMACPPHNKVQARKATTSHIPRNDYFNEIQECQPGKTFYNKCNSCRCGADGKSAACTMIACPPVEKLRLDGYVPGSKCPAGKTFYNRCNACRCGPNGHSAFCTLVACPDFFE